MNKSDLLIALNRVDRNDEIFVTGRDSEGKHKLWPVTSVAVCGEQIRIQLDEKDDAYAAYMSMVGIEAGTVENFKRDFCGMWGNKLSFATTHFQNKYNVPFDIRPFINYNAYCNSIFKTDFHANELGGKFYIFKKE